MSPAAEPGPPGPPTPWQPTAAWPLHDPALAERLTLPEREFRELIDGFMAMLELPPFDDAFYERAITYPWARPAGSYALDGDEVRPLTPARAAAVGLDGRVPLLAIGSNGAPSTLVRKFAHLPETEQQLVVVAGQLHGFDVGPAARITIYGSLPATPITSPGTAVRASVLWVTPVQLAALTWSELSYAVGWLAPVEFAPDEPTTRTGTPEVDRALVYVSRWGALTGEDGEPLALAALEAAGRTARACTQEQLLDRVAGAADLPDGRTLLAGLVAAPQPVMRALEPWLADHAAAFTSAAWHPFPQEPAPRRP